MQIDARLELPGDVRSPGEARRFVTRTLATLLGREDVETIALVTSELVTNATLHAATPCLLELRGNGRTVQVRVTDQAGGSTRKGELSLGRGLRLLEVLSRRWGVDAAPPHGKTVWAELKVTPSR